jgi:predicted NBD/HSP70 family sugar kinase/biotin operon repressor
MRIATTVTASKDAIRRQNLSALLRQVHANRMVSRAALGQVLGLSKTTIAELVSELEAAGLVDRVGNEQKAAAGRPSQLVAASSEPLVLVVNPEIDGITLAFVNFAAEILETEFVEFEKQYSLETTATLVQQFLAKHSSIQKKRMRGAVFAIPGAIDKTTNRLIDAPSLGWSDLDVSEELTKTLKMKVWITNNARAATVSEHLFGAAKGFQNAICLFSGVGGIGGGFIVNGRVLEGSNGIAGEIGKMNLISGGARGAQTFGELMRREEIVAALGKKRLSDAELDDLITNSTQLEVNKAIDGQVSLLLAAIKTLRDLFDPEAVILGGFLGSLVKSRKTQLLKSMNHDSLKEKDDEFLIPRAAELKPMVLIGAAETAWEQILNDPINHNRKAMK